MQEARGLDGESQGKDDINGVPAKETEQIYTFSGDFRIDFLMVTGKLSKLFK